MKISMIAMMGVSCIFLTACATFKVNDVLLTNHDKDYLNSENLPPLKIPAGVTMYPPDTYYTIPYHSAGQAAEVSLVPPGSDFLAQSSLKNTEAQHAKR